MKLPIGTTPHCIGRALERYGLVITTKDLRTIEAMIRDGQSLLIRRDRSGKEIHAIKFREEAVRLVYAPTDGHVVTFLPPKVRTFRQAMSRKRHRKLAEAIECTGANPSRRKNRPTSSGPIRS